MTANERFSDHLAERRRRARESSFVDVPADAWLRLLDFTWTDRTGRSWRATPTRAPDLGRTAWWVDLHVFRDGAKVGTAKRGVSRRGDGEQVARHEGLYLDEQAQRQGFGSAYLEHVRAGYPALGISAIEFVARDRGALAWARPGMEFRRPLARAFETNSVLLGVVREQAGDALPEVDRCIAEIVTGQLSKPHDVYAHPGGIVLLNALGEWPGRIPL